MRVRPTPQRGSVCWAKHALRTKGHSGEVFREEADIQQEGDRRVKFSAWTGQAEAMGLQARALSVDTAEVEEEEEDNCFH